MLNAVLLISMPRAIWNQLNDPVTLIVFGLVLTIDPVAAMCYILEELWVIREREEAIKCAQSIMKWLVVKPCSRQR